MLYSSGSSRLGVDGQWSAPQTLQLLPGELVLVDPRNETLSGRLPLEKMVVSTDERGRSFTVRTAATGICLVIDADNGLPGDGNTCVIKNYPNMLIKSQS